MTTLPTHVLDIERGAPAAGVPIALFRGEQRLTQAETNADGRIADLAGGTSLEGGSYRLGFVERAFFAPLVSAGAFFERQSISFPSDAPHTHATPPICVRPKAPG